MSQTSLVDSSTTHIHLQIDVMNTAYAGSFVFNLKDTDFTIHDIWATVNTDENEEAYKTVLQKGSYADLNLYFLSDLGRAENSTLLGFCYMPESDPDSQEVLLNGCTNLASTMPGGGSDRFGMGMTSVHEVGHVRMQLLLPWFERLIVPAVARSLSHIRRRFLRRRWRLRWRYSSTKDADGWMSGFPRFLSRKAGSGQYPQCK